MVKSVKNNKHSKEHKVKKNNTSPSSTDGLMKLAVVVAVFSILLFGVFSVVVGSKKDPAPPSRVVPNSRYTNAEGKPMEAEDGCEDRNSNCPSYAARGECDKAVGWMVGESSRVRALLL